MPAHTTLKVRRTDDISRRILRGQSDTISIPSIPSNRSDKT